MLLAKDDPLATAVTGALLDGDVDALRALLTAHPDLATAAIGDEREQRSLLHVLTDWPGHRPRTAETVAVLVAAGADVGARFVGAHAETPLHWAASNDDVVAVDALVDAGAELEAPGGVIAGGPPLEDARIFGQWAAARRLVERGARTALVDAAALGLVDRVTAALGAAAPDEVDAALWSACAAGRAETALLLADAGAQLDRVPPWEPVTPLDAARRAGADELVAALRSRGARSSDELPGSGP